MDCTTAGRARSRRCRTDRARARLDLPRTAVSSGLQPAGRSDPAMTRTRIKFCGITRVQDAQAAAALGVDAVGLVLTRKSPRFIEVAQAREIRRSLPPFVTAVVLFMDDEPAWIAQAIDD